MTVTSADDAQITPRVPAPARIGQGTAVDQARAVASVEAQIVVAMRHPRNVARAIEAMRDACNQKALADRAFFRYPRGRDANGKQLYVTGPSIHLARELARIWGNIEYGLDELRRDDDYGQSELLAYAWDVQTNTRSRTLVINPHRLYTGSKTLTELRDIYENNANVGARRVRECIFALLPVWFIEEAKTLCAETLSDGGGEPIERRRANAIEVFGNIGVTVAQLEAKLGAPAGKWTDQDLGHLRVIRSSIFHGEVDKNEEFPPEPVSGPEITSRPQGRARQQPAGEQQRRGEPSPQTRIGPGQLTRIRRLLADCAVPDDQMAAAVTRLAGKDIAALEDITRADFPALADDLKGCAAAGDSDANAAALVDLMRKRAAPPAPAGESGEPS